MIKVVFLNLLRSKYGIEEFSAHPGTISDILDEIVRVHPEIDRDDFGQAILFVNQIRMSQNNRFSRGVKDGDEVIFTHFLGGG